MHIHHCRQRIDEPGVFHGGAAGGGGSIIELCGQGAGGWKIAQNAAQTINKSASASTTGTGGSFASANRYNTITLRCTVANTGWVITGGDGVFTVV